MSEGDLKKPGKSLELDIVQWRRPFAYRALCKIAGIVSVVGALPGLAAAILGAFALATRPDATAGAYAGMAIAGFMAFGLIGLGARIYNGKVGSAGLNSAIYGYFTILNVTKDRFVGAAFSSLIAALCLAVVFAAWRLRAQKRSLAAPDGAIVGE